MKDDLISRQAAIDALGEEPEVWTGKDEYAQGLNNQWHYDRNAIMALPSAQPTLYGYKLEHLAYIARVMEKEGITAEDGHCHLAEPYVPDVNDGKKEDE